MGPSGRGNGQPRRPRDAVGAVVPNRAQASCRLFPISGLDGNRAAYESEA